LTKSFKNAIFLPDTSKEKGAYHERQGDNLRQTGMTLYR